MALLLSTSSTSSEPTHLKNISQNGNLLQAGTKIENVWNHHLVIQDSISNFIHAESMGSFMLMVGWKEIWEKTIWDVYQKLQMAGVNYIAIDCIAGFSSTHSRTGNKKTIWEQWMYTDFAEMSSNKLYKKQGSEFPIIQDRPTESPWLSGESASA